MLNKNNERELCYVVRIDGIEPIPGKDRVECAKIGGWNVMVKKDQFKTGDLGIYFEIDSLVPKIEPFLFLESKNFKIKTQKYKTPEGHFYSQGLLMHPSDFGWMYNVAESNKECLIDEEGKAYYLNDESRFLTKKLKVVYYVAEDNNRKANSVDKYKKMAQRHNKLFAHKTFRWLMRREWGRKLLFVFFGNKKDNNKKAFPTHLEYIKKSDEDRIENMPYYLEDKTPWIKTTKIDGTSSLFLLERKPFGRKEYWVCSRNVRQLDRNQDCYHDDNVYWEAEDKYKFREFLEDILKENPNLKYAAIQGEIAGCSNEGAKIQGDPHKFKELRFFGYNFITSDIGRWDSISAAHLADEYGIEWVPIVDDNYILPDTMEEMKLSADGPCEARGASGMREGYVYRKLDDNTKSFKNVSREYLMKHGG